MNNRHHQSSSQQRGLFDAPFLHSTSSYTESVPLRSENDSFSSPSRRRRRRTTRDEQWIVKTAMKAVLFSPVVVLMVWGVATILFSQKLRRQPMGQQMHKNKGNKNKQHASWRRGQAAAVGDGQVLIPQQGNGMVVQPSNIAAASGNAVSQAPPSPEAQQYYALFPENAVAAQQQRLVQSGAAVGEGQVLIPRDNGLIVQPPNIAAPGNVVPPQAAQYYPQPQFANQQPQFMRGAPPQRLEAPSTPDQIQGDQQVILPPPVLQNGPSQEAQYYYALPSDGAQPPVQQDQPRQQQAPRISEGTTRYFYYDPQTTPRDQNGNLYLPQTVYDAYGRPIHLQSLAAKSIIMEPPPPTMIHHNISNATTSYNFTHPNTVHTPVHDHEKGMVAIQDWGASSSADSSLIVCTVGVMALLVGALSARRLRSRSILSSCIENEALEDDAAYDAAYTMRYNTFSQGFNGDLEKFDV